MGISSTNWDSNIAMFEGTHNFAPLYVYIYIYIYAFPFHDHDMNYINTSNAGITNNFINIYQQ